MFVKKDVALLSFIPLNPSKLGRGRRTGKKEHVTYQICVYRSDVKPNIVVTLSCIRESFYTTKKPSGSGENMTKPLGAKLAVV